MLRSLPRLSRVIPEHTETVKFRWVQLDFSTMGDLWRNARWKAKDSGPWRCWWCGYEFEDGDQIALAQPMKGKNKMLCDSCGMEARHNGG